MKHQIIAPSDDDDDDGDDNNDDADDDQLYEKISSLAKVKSTCRQLYWPGQMFSGVPPGFQKLPILQN